MMTAARRSQAEPPSTGTMWSPGPVPWTSNARAAIRGSTWAAPSRQCDRHRCRRAMAIEDHGEILQNAAAGDDESRKLHVLLQLSTEAEGCIEGLGEVIRRHGSRVRPRDCELAHRPPARLRRVSSLTARRGLT